MIESVVPPLQRGLLQAGTLVLIGVSAWRLLIAPAALRVGGTRHEGGGFPVAVRFATLATLLLIPVWALRLYVQLLGFRDPFVPLREDLAFVVLETTWGTVWMAQGALLVVLLLVALLLRRATGPVPWAGLAVGSALLALTLALSSHAMSVEGNVPLAVAADTLHTLAAGAWLGSLLLVLRSAPPGDGLADRSFAAQLQAFSPVAMVSVGLLLAAGGYLSWQHLTAPADLWTSRYGQVLLAKMLVAGLVMGMGFLNWRRGIPVIDTAEAQAAVRRRSRWELFFALLVLALTAILTGTARPGEG